jgi:hypothetical protein
LRLDRRWDWTTTGASPFGLGFRGQLDPAHRDEFWLYDALGPRIWIHRDNERSPERPLVFVLETAEEQMEQRRRSSPSDRSSSTARSSLTGLTSSSARSRYVLAIFNFLGSMNP